ncbi:unnamed protein product [Prorocentrum cordatum]|uniref:Uncharacterized protein n=1 Tax=Prorocentrum cordatum TaxID=2364126 RepID=A0ABN9PLQ8_9DINO|nr:unnamed protein product [Polarella glacialis]
MELNVPADTASKDLFNEFAKAHPPASPELRMHILCTRLEDCVDKKHAEFYVRLVPEHMRISRGRAEHRGGHEGVKATAPDRSGSQKKS